MKDERMQLTLKITKRRKVEPISEWWTTTTRDSNRGNM